MGQMGSDSIDFCCYFIYIVESYTSIESDPIDPWKGKQSENRHNYRQFTKRLFQSKNSALSHTTCAKVIEYAHH